MTEIDITEQVKAQNAAEHMASHDALTGLHNRHYLTQNADRFLDACSQAGEIAWALLFDLDRFKFVNDTLGHAAGDAILLAVAEELHGHFPANAILGRLGGDEFCVLFRSGPDDTDIAQLSRSFLTRMQKPLAVGEHELRTLASIGISQSHPNAPADDFDSLLAQADLALYAAKEAGGGAIRIFEPQMSAKRARFLQVEEELRHALEQDDGRLHLHFQPIVDLQAQGIHGIEVLCRLSCQNGDPISPEEFIPIAEATGQITALGRWIIEEAIKSRREMPAIFRAARLCINVSPVQFEADDFTEGLCALAGRVDLCAEPIELEIIESGLTMEPAQFVAILSKVSDCGYSFAIDDFGVGFSNISRLRDYPIDILKIDRSLISDTQFQLADCALNIA